MLLILQSYLSAMACQNKVRHEQAMVIRRQNSLESDISDVSLELLRRVAQAALSYMWVPK